MTKRGLKSVLCFFLILNLGSSFIIADESKSQNEKDNASVFSKQLDAIKKLSPTEIAPGFEEKASEYVEKAFSLKLYDFPYWKTLLHYKRSAFHKNKSLIDDSDFFLAKNGKTNPKSELAATINAFFSPPPEAGYRHAIERFPARYKWICENLGLKDEDFPYQNGDKYYQTIVKNVNPGDVYLVFPTGYLKNPASVFGHTFLLVESKGQSRLLANSINYAATTGMTNGPLFAILGLTGGFRGYFGFMPYYDKIKQYSNMDMRDMWEYKLNLTDEETDRMLRHVFDLSGIYSRYFFISENCSYNLLFLLEAARPDSKVTSELSGVVEPIETVKVLYKLGFVDESEYRPSVYSSLENEKKLLSRKQNKFIKDVCLGKKNVEDFPFNDISNEEQALMWNLAADYLTILLDSGKITQKEYRTRFVKVLSARRKLGKIDDPDFEKPKNPKDSHGSKKLAMEGGKDAEGGYAGLQFRLTAHEQLENPAGYASNSELSFFQIDARFYPEKGEARLKKALLASVVSLPGSDLFSFNPAMQIVFGIDSNTNEDLDDELALRLKGLVGASFLPASWIQPYALFGGDAYFAPRYEYYSDVLLGGEAGFITTFGPWKNKMSASAMQSPFEKDHLRAIFSAEECVTIAQNAAVKGSYSLNHDWRKWWPEFSVSFNMYF